MTLYVHITHDGTRIFLHGDLGPHCRHQHCMDAADNLCDYPVGSGKTCDRPLCAKHSHTVAPDLHYCCAHHAEFLEFEAKGGIKSHLENVVPFPPMHR